MGYLLVGKFTPGNEEEDMPDVIEREYHGQGMIFKDEEAYHQYPERVCYIPELSDSKYTRNDFLDLCGGNESMAKELFDGCDWQHPESLMEDWIRNDEWEICDTCGTLFDCSYEKQCPNCGKPVLSDEPWHTERWYEEDLVSAMEKAEVPVTRENLDRMKEACKSIFEDKMVRNEMLVDKAKEIFEEVWMCH